MMYIMIWIDFQRVHNYFPNDLQKANTIETVYILIIINNEIWNALFTFNYIKQIRLVNLGDSLMQ